MAQLDTFNDKAGYWCSPDWQQALITAGIDGRTSGAIRAAVAASIPDTAVMSALAPCFAVAGIPQPPGSVQDNIDALIAFLETTRDAINGLSKDLTGTNPFQPTVVAAVTILNSNTATVGNECSTAEGYVNPAGPHPSNGIIGNAVLVRTQVQSWNAAWRPWADGDPQLKAAIVATGTTPTNCTLGAGAAVEILGNWTP